MASSSRATEFTVSQISDETRVSREPVISETGLAAWSGYSDDKGALWSDIYLYKDGKSHPLTRARTDPNSANIQPQIQSNRVVWVATFAGSVTDPDWVFREVPGPVRDAPAREVPARYIAHESGGHQWFTEVPSLSSSTNEPVSGVTTAAAPVAVSSSVVQAVAGETNSTAPVHPATTPAVITNAPPPIIEPPSDKFVETNEVRRSPSGDTEICLWDGGSEIHRVTRDSRDDLGPSIWGTLIAWQKAKGWPFGWEIMTWANGVRNQLTTNYYYDMAPKVQGNQVVWYGWDGHDFEIYLYDNNKGTTTQITSNQYDDVSPVLWDGVIAWEGYPGTDADIFLWKDGQTKKLSENIEDDLNPRIWNGNVVWQGFDGDDFEIYHYDGEKTIKLTSNTYDDLNPDIHDGLVCWMGYFDNWDAEIFVWDGKETTRLTDNDAEDRDPKTAAGKVIWQSDQDGKSIIFLAEPKK